MNRYTFPALFALFFISINPTSAQISARFDGANGGVVIVGESTSTCDDSIEGALRYISATPAIEFCDGSLWQQW